MYDVSGTDTDREWVEVFNAGASSVHFTDWKFFEANTNHGVTSAQGGENLASGAYAIIADNPVKFLLDWPSYSGILFDSTFSLGNSGETISVHMPPPELTDTDSIAYLGAWGAAGNGNSLQRTSASGQSFTEASPSPGTGALSSSGGGDGSSSSGSDSSAATSTVQSSGGGNSSGDSVMPPPPKVFADGGSDRTVIVGADTEFKARAYDEKKNLIDFSRFHWNFGDGTTAEVSTVLHRFEYPGRYVVVLDMPEEKDAAEDQIIVTVERVELGLSLMQDGGVLIENHAGRTLDLSRWIIRSLGRTFTIPEHTFILAGSPLRISQKTLGFSTGPDIELEYPNGVFALGTAAVSVSTSTTTPAPLQQSAYGSQTTQIRTKEVVSEAVKDIESVSTAPEAAAGAIDGSPAQIAAAGIPAGSSSRAWWVGLVGIAGFAAGSLALARRYGKKEWDIEEMG